MFNFYSAFLPPLSTLVKHDIIFGSFECFSSCSLFVPVFVAILNMLFFIYQRWCADSGQRREI